jgi:hypothetical protein
MIPVRTRLSACQKSDFCIACPSFSRYRQKVAQKKIEQFARRFETKDRAQLPLLKQAVKLISEARKPPSLSKRKNKYLPPS